MASVRTEPDVESLSPPLTTAELSDLLSAFNETTAELQSTHEALHQQVARLQSELVEARARLRRSEALAALGEMAAGIAHEVRNPLGSIQLYVQMLQEDVRSQPQAAELCAKISRSVQGLDAIVHDVLLFARETRVQAGDVPVREVIEAVLGEGASLLGDDVELEQDIEPGMSVCADRRLLVQAVGNLLRNAVEAMQDADCGQKRVSITARRESVRQADGGTTPMQVISIIDSGPGIAADIAQRIFNPFFTTRPTGTGLGLAIVNRVVEAHGGELRVCNNDAHGARASICLPIHESRGAVESIQESNYSREAVS